MLLPDPSPSPSSPDSWGSHRKVTLTFLLALLAVLAVFTFQVARPFTWPALVAVILAVAFHPLHGWLCRRIRWPGLAATISLIAAILLTLLPAAIVTTLVSRELKDLYASLSARSSAQGGWLPFLTSLWHRLASWLSQHLPGALDPATMEQEALTTLQAWAGKALANLAGLLGGFASFLFNLILTYFILFFLFRDGARIVQAILNALPVSADTAHRLLNTARQTLAANLYGVLGVAIAQGGLMALGLLFIGFPSPILWGIVAALLSMLPIIGPWLLWGPIALFLAAQGAYAKAVILVIWGAAVVGLADNVIRPWVVLSRTKQHPLLILLSILGGTHAFGFLGLLIGPIVVTLTLAVLETLREFVRAGSSLVSPNADLPPSPNQPSPPSP